MKYEIRDGKETYHGIKADVIASELERIPKNSDGYLRTEDVVGQAQDKANPLHNYFQWDNTRAGHEYRLQQARQLIRIIHIEDDGPLYYNIPVTRIISIQVEGEEDEEKTERVYQSATILVKRPDELQSAMEYLKAKMTAAIRAYDDAKNLMRDSAKEKQMKLVGTHLEKAQKAAAKI